MSGSLNVEEFNAVLTSFSNLLDIELATVIRSLALRIFNGVVKLTPVDTGHARASWQISVNVPDESIGPEPGEGEKFTKAAAAAISLSGSTEVLAKIKGHEVVWISNNVPYILYLEYGGIKGSGPKTVGGYSIQAPQGMVRITIAVEAAKMQRILDARADKDFKKVRRNIGRGLSRLL